MFGKPINVLSFNGFKIGIDISWFFIALILSWTLAAGYFPEYFPNLGVGTYWLMGIAGMLGLFISVVLHELGHAVVARRFNLPIEQITLFIFGGVAEMKKEPESPKAEFLIAIAGPIVSILIAFFMHFLTVIGKHNDWPIPFTGVTNYLAVINTIIVIFNLVPAFPLDGGRVLRALLWSWKGNLQWATDVSSRLGSAFGFGLIFLGILSFFTGNFFVGIWWMILGLFLRQAATFSRTQYYVKNELQNEQVAKFMTKDPISVDPSITLKNFIDQYVFQSHHHLYPVAEDDKLLGYISLKEVKAVPAIDWDKTIVKSVMVPVALVQTISQNTNVLDALNLFQETNTTTLLVVDGENLTGLLTAQDIFKIISLKLELTQDSTS